MTPELNQVVTFATDPRRGNPVFVLLADTVPNTVTAIDICRLLGTEYLVVLVDIDAEEPLMASFTPLGAHPGAGHGALAAAWLAFERYGRGRSEIALRLAAGGRRLTHRSKEGKIGVDWPAMPFEAVHLRAPLSDALGASVGETFAAQFGHVAFIESEAAVAALVPDLDRIAAFGRPAVIAVAPGTASDIVVRVFAPNAGLPEDPVCGTAHRILAPMFSTRLGKSAIHSRHLSPRGGDLWCATKDDTVTISGDAVLALRGELNFQGLGAPTAAREPLIGGKVAGGLR